MKRHFSDLDASAQRRCRAAWLDSEVTVSVILDRFRLSDAELRELARLFGPKPRAYLFPAAKQRGNPRRLARRTPRVA